MTTQGLSRESAKELLVAWRELPVTRNCRVWEELRRFGLTVSLVASSPLQQTKHDVRYLGYRTHVKQNKLCGL